MRSTRRGLENIVAALLLIVIVSVGVLILYYWLSVYTQNTSSYIAQQAVIEHIEIVGLNLTETSSGVNVTAFVLNSGKFPVKIVLISIENATSDTLVDNCINNIVGGVIINPGETKPVSIVCSLTTGTYTVKVFTERGTEAETSFTIG